MLRHSVLALSCLLTLVSAASLQLPFKLDRPVHTTDSWRWEDCGNPETDVIKINDIQVTPDPPQPGKELSVTVNGLARQTITDGAYADVVVKLGLIKLLSKRFDLCTEARNANASIQCPIKDGEHQVTHVVELPKEIPRAKFKVHVDGFTNDDDDMFCVDLLVDFMKIPHLW
ncbi:Phosphatidylglycerol/phosphatidylinositol transfer protein [Marasmius oreades]|uniref:Phosphatidylglycerol/phosphatidylinositol transfer protein n=1 Tax=Marasmius oreades TaxID=181124 RepID=A0A9P7V2U1_9AGAR|nr:Phosphatidylglycerol/phosphatidylinositol transfer protein [Marasmius oreades]KAG7099295.1 Phosphatidylglycerol/phosphatidylinositol transfer protein [Marasmius oreades]